jgi:hypothetical protein
MALNRAHWRRDLLRRLREGHEVTTFYCLHKECRKPIEVRRAVPDRCPHCAHPFQGTTTPPTDPPAAPRPLDDVLSLTDRDFLKVQRIKP